MKNERAWVTGWMLCVLLLCGATVVIAVRATSAVATLADVQAVADLCALAGTGGGEAAARAVAVDNQAVLVRFEQSGAGAVSVTVRRHGAAASASATRIGERNSHPGTADP